MRQESVQASNVDTGNTPLKPIAKLLGVREINDQTEFSIE